MKNINLKIIILLVFSLISILFVYNDYFLYKTPIIKITNIKTNLIQDDIHIEKNYEQKITGKIMNGKYKGKVIKFTHTYSESLVVDDKYENHTELFVNLSPDGNQVLGVTSIKRDKYLVILLVIFIDLLVLVAGKKGIKTLVSLIINLGISAGAIILFMNNYLHINMLLLYILVSIIYIIVSLFITNGKSKKTLAAIISSIVSLFVSFLFSFILIKTNEKSMFVWMIDYIEAVYDYYNYLYVIILLSGLGAIMDISITIASTLNELILKNSKIDKKTLLKSGKEISKDIVGTMINVMLFTCYTSVIPTVILATKNKMSFTYALNYYGGIELTVVLCTCIGIVLTIPISLFVSMKIFNKKGSDKHE
jgi:uncharacterized membrane protein